MTDEPTSFNFPSAKDQHGRSVGLSPSRKAMMKKCISHGGCDTMPVQGGARDRVPLTTSKFTKFFLEMDCKLRYII